MKLSFLPKSNLISIFFSKKVFLCLVFLCFVGSFFGAEYVWTGRGDGSTWTDKDNWGGSGYPGESDNATFSSGAEVTITSNITVNQIYLNASSKVTCDSNVTISLNSIITQGEFLNKGTLQKRENVSFIIKVEAGGKLINENKIICTDIEGLGNSNITNNGTIEASGAATFQSGANFTNADTSELYIGGAMTNVGTFSNSGGTVTVKGTTTNTGTITNTGDFTSEGAITNNNGGKITNNSSGTISGNINNTGGTVTNNGGTISDEVSGGTFEDNPIVVYSTISPDSSDTVLDWNVASSWENGVVPDISGDTAVEITLNTDVSIEDFQAFFSAGNETITLNGTGNLLYNGKKIYISQKSDTELNWNTAENWINGVVPIITGEGKQEVVIVLNSDFTSSETLVFNNATGAAIHIYLCNKKLSADSVQLVSDWTHPENNPAGNIHFYGPGTVETKILDASNNTNRTSTHRISLYDETIFKITEHAYADPARGEIIDTTGNCEVYLPASGFDMRVPSGKGDGATFRIVGTQAKAIEPQSYYKIELTSDISDTEKIFTFSRSETGKHNYDLNFPYVVYLMGDASWKLGDTELSDGFEGNVTIPKDNIENGTSQIEKTISLSSGTVESGDGIKVIFYTPCKNLVLNEFIYEKEIIYWTGDVSEDFSTPENWTLSGTPLGSLDELTGKTVKIPSNCTNYPKLSSDISLEKLVVEDGAEVTIIDNGKLTVEKIHIYDSGALKAESGTVVFSGENPSYFAKYPEFSKFGTIEVASGTFNLNYPLTLTQLNIALGASFSTLEELVISSIENNGDFSITADLHITKSLTNNGTFQAEKVYLEPSENEVTIIGQSGDSEIAEKTKISELYCINQAGKNLVINNAISVEKIALSGSSDNSLSIRGNGIIYLETECGDDENDIAQYLNLDESSLPKIENQYITVSDGQFSSENNDIFVENHWINGDAIEYKWVGGASGNENNWNERTNWNIRKVPGEDKNVIIPACPNPPILTGNPNKLLSLSVEEGASINFAGKDVTATTITNQGEIDFAGSTVKTDSITNNDTVKLTGKEVLQIQDIENGEESTVIYYGTNENAEFVWGGSYEKLIIESGFSGSCDRGIIIKNSLKFKNSSGNFDLVCENLGNPNVAELSGAIELKNLTDFVEIKFAGNGIFTGTMESSRNTKLTSDYGRICFDSNIDANFNSPLTVQTTALDQGFLPAGTITLGSTCEVLCNLYLTNQVSFNIGGKLSVGNQTEPKDVYISAMEAGSPLDVEIAPKDATNQEFQVYGNLLLLNVNAKISTDLTVGKDMILLNGEKPAMFNDPISGIEGLFAYNLSGRGVGGKTAAINFTNDFPTKLPKGTASGINQDEDLDPTKYVSTFDFATGKTILVWNNFYNNGVDLGTNTTGSWNLKFPANDVATSSFAECYNATIKNCVVAANTTPGEAWLSTENCTDGTGNTNVAFSKAIFANVATISDNIIRVSFVDGNSPLDEKPEIKIENSCNEISSWAATDNFRFNISSELPEGVAFSGVYANPECTESTNGKGDLSTFYLKYDGSDYRWNTDATGSDPGAEESTDYSRNHKNVVPNLLFKRAIEASYAGLRDEHKNRLVSVGTGTAGAEPLFEATKDEAPPVLIAVTLGQEQHETEATAQHHYDSHNFIEWQFSEPVEFENYPENGISQIDGVETSAESENIQSTTNFGKITNNGNGFSVAGFGSFETGKVSLGSKTGSGEVNAFYRKFALEAGEEAISQKNRIRLSIAGYVDKENPVVVNGVDYKNWLGFIDSKNTIIPSGTFRMSEEYSKSIKDLAGNEGISPKDSIITNAIYSSMSQDLQAKTLYGTWDIDPPVVANYMKETSSGIYAQEILPVGDLTSDSAKSLEIHFLDNSAYNTLEGKNNLQWRTKIGWKENNVQINQTIPLDTKGGSRMTSDYNKTLGGLRFSTIIDSLDAFVCQNITTKENIDLIESEAGFSQTTTNKNIFGESDVNQFDVPYLTLKFEDAKGSLLKHNYELKYNTEKGFITDLAGNLLYDFTVNSPDKNPPQFLLSIGGVNYDKLYILFSKPIDYLNQNNEPDEGKLRRIVKSLSVFESTSDGEKDTGLIDYKLGSEAKVVTKTKESTGIEISLTRKVSYDELKNLYIGVNTFDSTTTDEDADSSLGDPITGDPGEYSMLYDMFENPISEDSKHCFSDFAVNAFDVLYAYDGRAVEEAALAQGVFGGNQWTVTDFSGETNNSSKIIAGKDITIAGKIVDSSENPDEQDKFSMLADISPAKNKAGLDFEDYTDRKTRLWFPDFVKLFPVNNSSTSESFTTDNLVDNGKIETKIDGKDNNSFTYVIPNNKDDSQSVNWADGDEFEFLFKIYNSDNEVIMVDGNVDGDTDDEVDHPLFALRLKDENDITSIDLWSLHIVELVRQKGGTTILNNVINSLNNEETVVEVQVPQTGFLTVQVLTLDGNVVKVLQRGRVEEGTYYYKWNGTNISGAAVARGMYFVRVVGPNIDETRKVMVIKE